MTAAKPPPGQPPPKDKASGQPARPAPPARAQRPGRGGALEPSNTKQRTEDQITGFLLKGYEEPIKNRKASGGFRPGLVGIWHHPARMGSVLAS